MVVIDGYSKYESEVSVLIGSHNLTYVSQNWAHASLIKRSCDLTPPPVVIMNIYLRSVLKYNFVVPVRYLTALVTLQSE